jgi:F-box-like
MVEHIKPRKLLDLPPEILVQVFLLLPWKRLAPCGSVGLHPSLNGSRFTMSCQVCKRFHDIITSSTEINYKIELAIAGYQNGHTLCKMPLSQRLRILRQTQKGWLGLNFQRRETIQLERETPTYELQGSVFLRGRSSTGSNSTSGISGYIMASALTGDEMHQWTVEHFPMEVRDFTLDPLQDLLVLIEEQMDEWVLQARILIYP